MKCRCDGQFSEDDLCRKFKSNKFHIVQPKTEGFCPNLTNDNEEDDTFLLRKINKRSKPDFDEAYRKGIEDIDCTVPVYRGMLLVLQGGMHFRMDSAQYIEEFLEPLLNHQVVQSCAENGKLFMIWQDHGSQSPLLDITYPHQNAANTTRFNREVHAYLDQRGLESIPRIDWMNLTKLSQTSDGLHATMNGKKFEGSCRPTQTNSSCLTYIHCILHSKLFQSSVHCEAS